MPVFIASSLEQPVTCGLSLKRIVQNLNKEELERLKDGIQRIEGWREGEESILGPAKKIIDVKRNKSRKIVGYLVEDLGVLVTDKGC